SAEIARELYADAKTRGFEFIDAPVSGGQAGAENGALTVMCGGDAPAFARGEKIIAAYAKACTLMGEPGAGQLAKMVNQICIAGLVQGLAEGLHFAKKANLDIEKLIATISKGAAQSWQMENRYKTMVEDKFDFGFAVDWMRKDLAICLAEANRNGALLIGGFGLRAGVGDVLLVVHALPLCAPWRTYSCRAKRLDVSQRLPPRPSTSA
ncbi:MAG TPA: NAD(P)-dependent oxidoreductase, partial [Rhizomicrobium sp.]|nr:NAD(P)-dependent oxidoreductase [Rhizomicrobium sp.]